MLMVSMHVHFWRIVNFFCSVSSAEESIITEVEPGTIMDMNGEPLEFIDMPPSAEHIDGKSQLCS